MVQENSLKPKIVIICGPTASGKTAFGVEVAKLLNSEVVSADSMYIYQGLDIGTAKPDEMEIQADAEKEAQEIIDAAKKHAATIIESSKIEIEKRKKEILQEAQSHVEQAIKEKRLLAQFDSEKIKEETTNKINSLV